MKNPRNKKISMVNNLEESGDFLSDIMLESGILDGIKVGIQDLKDISDADIYEGIKDIDIRHEGGLYEGLSGSMLLEILGCASPEDYALKLAKENKFKGAACVFSACFNQTSVQHDRISEFAQYLIEYYLSLSIGRDTTRLIDPWSCMSCAGVLVDPITITCGHTYCKKCLIKNTSRDCLKCGSKWEPMDETEAKDPKVTILVSELVQKYWSADLRAIELRNEGNKFFQRGDIQTAINKYSEAVELAPLDHLLAGNRSHAYHQLDKFHAALDDAEVAIKAKPDWGKGYFRKGMALLSQEQYGEALISYFQCLVLEETCSKALRSQIIKCLYKIFIVSNQYQETEDNYHSQSSHIEGEDNSQKTDEDSDGESIGLEPFLDHAFFSYKGKVAKHLITKNRTLCTLLDRMNKSVEILLSSFHQPRKREIPQEKIDKDDFECSLCYRNLWHPVSTTCGHTYCKSCLDRTLDHKLECPLCKTTLDGDFAERKEKVNEFVEETFRRVLNADYIERQRIYEDEMSDLLSADDDGKTVIPVFVCTMSFPTVPCPLHVFEPRYRLMMRRVMLAGTREFGMCTNAQNRPFAEYGTMLEIRDIQYFPDGRSVVDTVGGRRFKVFDSGTKDGYQTAKVEFLTDVIPTGEELVDLRKLHDETRATAETWFGQMDDNVKTGILSHYGDMPAMENDYWSLNAGPAWTWWILAILPLDTGAQQHILSQTLLQKRLEAIGRILGFIERRLNNR